MADGLALAAALVALAASLTAAVLSPGRGWASAEWLVAGVGALVLLAVGAAGAERSGDAVGALAPTVGFLAALLVLAEGCRREGLFRAVGSLLAGRSGGERSRLLMLVFVVASATTIVLGLDATVVLLTPVVLLTVRRLRVDPKPPVYACAHLANSASLLLPVSNLTNLLAFRASGLSFARFAALMAAPTVAALAVEWVVLRWLVPPSVEPVGWADSVESAESAESAESVASAESVGSVSSAERLPRFPLAVLALTLAGFALSSVLGVAPVWIAVAGAAAITAPALARRDRSLAPALVGAIQPGFLGFVIALGVIVAAAGTHGLTSAVRDVLPSGQTLPDLILTAVIAAVLANLVNNLPATLILVPVAAQFGAGPVLAVLIGVNLGPNLTDVGSLATLLWRRILRDHGLELGLGEFVRLGAITVAPGLVGCTALLWLALKVV